MDNLTSDEIAIDTNVFEHLLNEGCKFNEDGNVRELLTALVADRIHLCVDSSNYIRNEYLQHIAPMLRSADDTGTQLTILRYWMDSMNHREIDGSTREYRAMYTEVDKIIRGQRQRTDRHFVTVAFVRGRILVSNDELHIVMGNHKEVNKFGWRRDRLLRATKKMRPNGSAIMFSSEANSSC